MLGIAIDALLLIVLLQAINEDNIGFGTAFIVALVASIGTAVLASVLVASIGFAGILVAPIIAAALIGVALSTLVGVEIKRAFFIGGIFMLVRICIGVAFQLMFRA